MSEKIEHGITAILSCPHCNKKIKVGVPKKTAKAILHSFKTRQNTVGMTLIWEATE